VKGATGDFREFAPGVFGGDAVTRTLGTFVRVPPEGDGLVALAVPFLMQRFPVTNALFSRFIAETDATGPRYITTAEQLGHAWVLDGDGWRHVANACWNRLPHSNPDQEMWRRQPATCVSWFDAVAFTEWLNKRVGADSAGVDGFVVRLPTEAEWEFACRAGTRSPFWWGDALNDEHAVHRCGAFPKRRGPEPVELDGQPGRGRWNPWGLCDISGNVWEWCLDVYDPAQPERRVLRGGSWGSSSSAGRMLSCFRGHMPANEVGDRNGFRLVYGARPNTT
jgi:formylglycine-generating enzyme required for sulfatase activity